ncbi:MAG: SDR family NAD(P)-dependent oxidoreductase [Streptosporangiaceae bacterium]|nr:SDR family NAD(P)-dependent oxidoreductase [Streptosporangiaceae bacterium]
MSAMSGNEISGVTALVTGASRGFGRGIATALSAAGAQVVGVARDRGPLEELRAVRLRLALAIPCLSQPRCRVPMDVTRVRLP